MTSGKVSALRSAQEVDNTLPVIQADVSVYPGNSGGPLVDDKGNVVGITVATMLQGGGAATNLNFFIPIMDALEKLNIRIGG